MQISIGLSLTALRGGVNDPAAPDYEEPDEPPIDPPEGDPPPTDPPEFDPDYVAPLRLDVIDDGEGVIRLAVEENTWANAYIAAPISGPEYCEIEIHMSTPRNATMAVGFSTLAMPLNGIPGELPGTIAYWSDGRVRQNGVTLATLSTWGRGDRIGIALDELQRFLRGLNCSALSSALGDLSAAATLYPFIGLYSTGARARFRFSVASFGCTLPDGFYPIGQVPLAYGEASISSLKTGAVLNDGTSYTDAAQLSSLKIGAVLREV